MKFTWTITAITDVESMKTSGWSTDKKTLVLEEISDKQYKSSISIEFWGEKLWLVDWLQSWDQVEVSMNSKVREYNWKYYTSISWWKVESIWEKSEEWEDLPF